jgi:tetratricopeptide (TPR) repeat protein
MQNWPTWRISRIFLFITSLVLLVPLLQILFVRVCVNIGYIDFTKALHRTHREEVRIDFGYNNFLDRSDVVVPAFLFEKALSVSAFDLGARRGLGRVWLSQKRADQAARTLHPIRQSYAEHPLFFVDLLKAYSLAGRDEDIRTLVLSEGWQYVPESILSRIDWGGEVESVAHTYRQWHDLRFASHFAEQSREFIGSGAPLLHQVRCLTWLEAKGDSTGFINGLNGLRNFDLPALFVSSGALSILDLDLIPGLIQSGFWSQALARNVVSWLVWRHFDADELDTLLTTLIAQYPQVPVWPFYYAEYYQRRGDLSQAAMFYQQALDFDYDQPDVLLRLGSVLEAFAQEDHRVQALSLYERYLQMNPGDFFAGKQLLGLYQSLDDSRFEDLKSRFFEKTDLTTSVARLLEVASSQIRLGPNLAPVGDFGQWKKMPSGLGEKPRGWHISNMAYKGSSFNSGAFVCGPDIVNGWQGFSARISGIWLERKGNLTAGRFGFWFGNEQVHLEPLTPYVISFYYKTQGQVEEPAIWLSSDTRVLLHAITGSDDYRLPPTSGQWWKFVAVAWNQTDKIVKINPLLRTHTIGDIWFDNFQISKVVSNRGVLADHSVRVGIEHLDMKPY